MKELLPQINKWQLENKAFKIARVIQTWGSSPRPVGSTMLISNELSMVGSVSGGCVEGAVLKESQNLIAGESKILQYGVTDEDAWAVGLTCGGKLTVFLQSWYASTQKELSEKLLNCLRNNEGCALISRLTNSNEDANALISEDGKLLAGSAPTTVLQQAKGLFDMRKSETLSIDGVDYFVHSFPKRSRLIIIGAAHITVDLVALAKQFDFETIVIDPRGTFLDKTIFDQNPDQLIEKYPSEVLDALQLDPNTYTVVLSHDPKIDDDALKIILRNPVAYVGALGSRKNQEKRVNRLRDYGFSEEEIARIDAPIGVDINAKGAREIALSIMGSVIKAKNKFL